jgi:hypothetical protein
MDRLAKDSEMPIDLNFTRRKRELAIADEIATELLRSEYAEQPSLISNCIADVCVRRGWFPSEHEMRRVLTHVRKRGAVVEREVIRQ